jgi:F-type H+-transporting ATPase subunit epsilon
VQTYQSLEAGRAMRLQVLLPNSVLLNKEVTKITAEAETGSFTLLPRHVDYVMALVPGLLTFASPDAGEEYVAIAEGILVKVGPEVRVSTRNAIYGVDLGMLHATIEEEFEHLDESERRMRSALVGLEMDLVRRFMNLRD